MPPKTTKGIKRGTEAKNYVPNQNVMGGIFDVPGAGGFGGLGGGQPLNNNGQIASLSQPLELIYNESYYLLSVLRTVLTYAYTIHGPLRKVVNTPVYDAFRGGIKIKTDEVSEEDLEALHRGMKERKVQHKVVDAMRWNRLYGGAGIIINTNQDYSKPMTPGSITESSKLGYIVADRWQLTWKGVPDAMGTMFQYSPTGNYVNAADYINNLDPSRVARINGEEAPALVRGRLAGWGMSVLEPIIRPINMYLKLENALYEYVDEFKVDIMKIDGFNAQSLSKMASGVLTMRLRIALWMKNFMNAIVMDAKDDFQQKQITLGGLAEVMEQCRINMACSCEMPISKLYGISMGNGFDSGEIDLEVYNSLVENERERAEKILDIIIPIEMMKTWGFVPDNWRVEWKKLRVLSDEQEELVQTSKQNRILALYDRGLYTPQEAMEAAKQEELVSIDTAVGRGAEPEPPMFGMGMMEEDSPEEPKALGGPKKKSAKKGKD